MGSKSKRHRDKKKIRQDKKDLYTHKITRLVEEDDQQGFDLLIKEMFNVGYTQADIAELTAQSVLGLLKADTKNLKG
jgi:hypothetical protein